MDALQAFLWFRPLTSTSLFPWLSTALHSRHLPRVPLALDTYSDSQSEARAFVKPLSWGSSDSGIYRIPSLCGSSDSLFARYSTSNHVGSQQQKVQNVWFIHSTPTFVTKSEPIATQLVLSVAIALPEDDRFHDSPAAASSCSATNDDSLCESFVVHPARTGHES